MLKPQRGSLPREAQVQVFVPRDGDGDEATIEEWKAGRLQHLHKEFGDFDEEQILWIVVTFVSSAEDVARAAEKG
jgi:hypothetical protein